ncbi:MAG: UDP-N-acetylmuramoyl-L-alanyl-D-glutamate--2,6-diaminopimelate ligase [Thermodesulfovibrio sp. RBG_19FT_COMBO_42_12]|nr:MAG: UDP-N-acetylmuramoyl-L-alanyl-D-glutamate--2,6-diaminopimelate ligase [Thermodesulfovibrio sp. RBG_19FT_COMBO_42_12]
MRLKEVMRGCDYTPSLTLPPRGGGLGEGDMDISGVAYDSRKVKENCLFVAITGERYDGHDFIKDVIEGGAAAIVYERNINETGKGRMGETGTYSPVLRVSDSPSPLPLYISVKNTRKALACIANNFYGRPSDRLTLIGITGTNGKTTTTYILKSILESWGKEVGLIGTIQYLIKDRVYPALHTTPESLEFQGLLKDIFLSGCTHVISEVSSHALAQYRVDGAGFKTAVFTNLTGDHLDFHKTMEDYFRAKERLFRELLNKDGTSVINLDDPYGRSLVSSLVAFCRSQNILTYGLETGADIMAVDIDNSFQGLRFKILFRGRNYDISSHLIGQPNVYNIMSAVGVSISLGVPWQVILKGIEKAGNVTGRFEKVDIGQGFLCIIDYAHSEDALERLICTARELTLPPHPPLTKGGYRGGDSSPRIITVFGCGGDRDRGKRPRMGAVATRLSDFVIITSDNPRSEEPADIIKEIEGGIVSKNYLIEPYRREAIMKAVDMADDGDIVLIAGKGHEDYQEIKGVRYRFNDRDVIEGAIKDKLQRKDSGSQGVKNAGKKLLDPSTPFSST